MLARRGSPIPERPLNSIVRRQMRVPLAIGYTLHRADERVATFVVLAGRLVSRAGARLGGQAHLGPPSFCATPDCGCGCSSTTSSQKVRTTLRSLPSSWSSDGGIAGIAYFFDDLPSTRARARCWRRQSAVLASNLSLERTVPAPRAVPAVPLLGCTAGTSTQRPSCGRSIQSLDATSDAQHISAPMRFTFPRDFRNFLAGFSPRSAQVGRNERRPSSSVLRSVSAPALSALTGPAAPLTEKSPRLSPLSCCRGKQGTAANGVV